MIVIYLQHAVLVSDSINGQVGIIQKCVAHLYVRVQTLKSITIITFILTDYIIKFTEFSSN